MKIELSKLTRKELEKLRRDVDKALSKATQQELKKARDAAAKAAASLGFSLEELVGTAKAPAPAKKKKKAAGTKAPAKFANPEDPKKTWTGKGRQPEWYKAAIAAGKTPEDLAI